MCILFLFNSLDATFPWRISAVIMGILCLVLLGTAVALAAKCHSLPGCPDQWVAYRHSCYFFSRTKKDRYSSQKSCSTKGSRLLVISDAQEMDLFKVIHTEPHWIGLRNITGSGWAWEDGSGINYIKVISNSHVQDCVVLLQGLLQASSCEVPSFWICEKDLK
ncbi:killer cell lectin-like receptor subfamily G member 1 [Carettochelys insculpta]|uniref:killer cell lectin-like receptor subfamily G member 1 n=1 Tax=Carettochelys insculpta TaxID=44489 RepID=UPI003EBBE9E0